MKKSRYIIAIQLLERDDVNPSSSPKLLHTTGVFRTHNQGEARLHYDNIVTHLRKNGWSYDNDPISRGR